MKKTPLYEKHVSLGAKMIEFGGWTMPLQYTGILQEHEAVRQRAGLFDVSHMGEVMIKGRGATEFIQKLITNDISGMREFQVLYSPMCYPDGGTVDDLLVYKFDAECYLLVVNAANIEKDVEWIESHKPHDVEVEDVSEQYAQLALQGPKSQEVLQRIVDAPLDKIKFFRFVDGVSIAGVSALISRTGYTGEDGFEIYIPADSALETGELYSDDTQFEIYIPADSACKVWNTIVDAGAEFHVMPAGLGARDTLRLEAALPLYGHELSPDISPLEAGLDRFVKLDKPDFIGREALIKQKESGISRKLVGLEMVDKGIPRQGYEVQVEGRSIGYITSGGFSPTLKKNIALALMDVRYAARGSQVDVIVRNKALKAEVVKIPFYAKQYKK